MIQQIISLLGEIGQIYYSGLSWKNKHALIFKLWDERPVGMELEWYSPDMDYEDDIKAFMEALIQEYGSLHNMTWREQI